MCCASILCIDGMLDAIESPDGEGHALEHRRSVPQITDRQIDDILITSGEGTTAEPGYTHTWPNKTIYYSFERTLSKFV